MTERIHADAAYSERFQLPPWREPTLGPERTCQGVGS